MEHISMADILDMPLLSYGETRRLKSCFDVILLFVLCIVFPPLVRQPFSSTSSSKRNALDQLCWRGIDHSGRTNANQIALIEACNPSNINDGYHGNMQYLPASWSTLPHSPHPVAIHIQGKVHPRKSMVPVLISFSLSQGLYFTRRKCDGHMLLNIVLTIFLFIPGTKLQIT